MCPENRNVCVLKMELKKPLDIHEHMVGTSLDIFSMVEPRFSGVLVVLYGDAVNQTFLITLMISVKVLPMNLCDRLDFIPTGLN